MEEIKKRLNAFRDARRLYESAKLESEKIATMLTSAAIDYSKVKVQTSPHDFTDTMARLVDLHNECVKRMAECVDAMEEAEKLVSFVEDTRKRELLTRRYIGCETWEEIAEKMGLDYRWAFRLHDQALQEIKEKERNRND